MSFGSDSCGIRKSLLASPYHRHTSTRTTYTVTSFLFSEKSKAPSSIVSMFILDRSLPKKGYRNSMTPVKNFHMSNSVNLQIWHITLAFYQDRIPKHTTANVGSWTVAGANSWCSCWGRRYGVSIAESNAQVIEWLSRVSYSNCFKIKIVPPFRLCPRRADCFSRVSIQPSAEWYR